ncbi:hypothetical protein K438DRAFT_1756032 [Mycena galopus ATCC 62051]|nr:hypothetical protein K438DRAFT_1756032 [Mycena galopus ATCC 62051]
MAEEFHVSRQSTVLMISMIVLGLGLGPLITGLRKGLVMDIVIFGYLLNKPSSWVHMDCLYSCFVSLPHGLGARCPLDRSPQLPIANSTVSIALCSFYPHSLPLPLRALRDLLDSSRPFPRFKSTSLTGFNCRGTAYGVLAELQDITRSLTGLDIPGFLCAITFAATPRVFATLYNIPSTFLAPAPRFSVGAVTAYHSTQNIYWGRPIEPS